MANTNNSNKWLLFQYEWIKQFICLRDSKLIVYDKLWETMKKKNMTQYRLIHEYNISAGQLSRLRRNAYISTHTVEILCDILDCDVCDIVSYIPKK